MPDKNRLIFPVPGSNLECCCFISNDEFLSGSDNGSIALWSILKKKPVSIVENAHPVIADGLIANGNLGKLI